MISFLSLFKHRTSLAWLALMATLGLHVYEEATTGFLPYFNALLSRMAAQFPYLPRLHLDYDWWLGILIGLLVIGVIITPLLLKGWKWIRLVVTVISILMIGNALAHLVGSAYELRLLPGAWSSPLVLAAAVWLVIRIIRRV